MKRISLAVSLLVLGFVLGEARGVVINMPGDFGTIQGAIDAAVNGDEIVVSPGTYHEVINFNGKAINLHSLSGDPVDTIIDGTGLNDSVVLCISGEGAGTVLEGFTIMSGAGNTSVYGGISLGGGMFNNGSEPTVKNCTFSGNAAQWGSGMYNFNCGSPNIINCTISGNTATNGGGMYNFNSNPVVTDCTISGNAGIGIYNNFNSNPTVTNCTFSKNTNGGMYNNFNSSPVVTNCNFRVNWGGGGMRNIENCSPTVTNCAFVENSGYGGMYNIFNSSPTVSNCTFAGNSNFGGMYNRLDSSPMVTNCIFSGNSSDGGMRNLQNSNPIVTNCTFSENTGGFSGGGMYNSNSNPIITNCIFWGNSPNAIKNILSLPVISFSIVEGGLPDSAVDGGGNLGDNPYFVDADGADNISGTQDDDLRLFPASTAIDAGNNSVSGLAGMGLDLDGLPRFFDDAGVTDKGNGIAPVVDMGAYERQVESVFTTLRVPLDFTTIQGAINAAAVSGSEIVVAPGTYHGAFGFAGKAIYLHSESGNPADTILDGTGFNSHVVLCLSGEGTGTILEGFTVTGGHAVLGGGMFTANGGPTIIRCIFRGNEASEGGGLYNFHSSPTITNCTFSGNTSTFAGGGMFNFHSSPNITNSTFSGNMATNGGGMQNVHSFPSLANSILWGNFPNEILNASSSLRVSFSNVQGGLTNGSVDGGGNISTDPQFVDTLGPDFVPGTQDDDLRLLPGSPCIDAGYNSLVIADTIDLDNDGCNQERFPFDLEGNPRFMDDSATLNTGCGVSTLGVQAVVDMGAYEFVGTVAGQVLVGDTNGNGLVNIDDLVDVLNAFGFSGLCSSGDINGNGLVDINDLVAVMNSFGGCG